MSDLCQEDWFCVGSQNHVIRHWHAMVQGLRSLCTENGTLLCFDEVMTGFRIAKGCAQAHFGIMPDLTTVRFFLPIHEKPYLVHHSMARQKE